MCEFKFMLIYWMISAHFVIIMALWMMIALGEYIAGKLLEEKLMQRQTSINRRRNIVQVVRKTIRSWAHKLIASEEVMNE